MAAVSFPGRRRCAARNASARRVRSREDQRRQPPPCPRHSRRPQPMPHPPAERRPAADARRAAAPAGPSRAPGPKRIRQPERQAAPGRAEGENLPRGLGGKAQRRVRPTKRAPRSRKISAPGSGGRSKKPGSARASPPISAPAPRQGHASRSASARPGRDHHRVCAGRRHRAAALRLPGALPAGKPPLRSRAPAACARGCRPDRQTGQSGPAQQGLPRQKTSLFQHHRGPALPDPSRQGRRIWGGRGDFAARFMAER
jgi:hypothetical protein